MICAQVHTQCHKSGGRYTLGARYLYFKRNAEKFGVRAIGRKIRYIETITKLKYAMELLEMSAEVEHQ
jgi:hypothetical protein